MGTIRDLKKIINYDMSSVIEECYVWQLTNPDDAEKAEKIIDNAIDTFDELIARVNEKKITDKKAHFKAIQSDLDKSVDKLMKKLVKL
jgi:hypothetical protein